MFVFIDEVYSISHSVYNNNSNKGLTQSNPPPARKPSSPLCEAVITASKEGNMMMLRKLLSSSCSMFDIDAKTTKSSSGMCELLFCVYVYVYKDIINTQQVSQHFMQHQDTDILKFVSCYCQLEPLRHLRVVEGQHHFTGQ